MNKYLPVGTKTKILVNPNDFEHTYIIRTKKEKQSDYKTIIDFSIIGIGAIILYFVGL